MEKKLWLSAEKFRLVKSFNLSRRSYFGSIFILTVRNESLKAELEIEMDRKGPGHLIHLAVSEDKFAMSNACEILCNKNVQLLHFNHFCNVTIFQVTQNCLLNSSSCILIMWEIFPFECRNDQESQRTLLQLFFVVVQIKSTSIFMIFFCFVTDGTHFVRSLRRKSSCSVCYFCMARTNRNCYGSIMTLGIQC